VDSQLRHSTLSQWEKIIIEQNAINSMWLIRQPYDNYLASGKHFHSWNDPRTPEDGIFNTFMTIAYKFFEHAEQSGSGYRIPVKK
jgi:hypothetical protein